MAATDALVLALALRRIPRLRSAAAARLVAREGSSWRVTAVGLVDVCGSDMARAGPTQRIAEDALRAAERDATRIVGLGWSWTVPADAGYPARLWRLASPPLALFVRGVLPSADRSALAVVGTRHPSPSGRALADAAANEGITAAAAIVAGLAVGVDTIAHRAAVDRACPTWAILPSSLDRPYPPSNTDLAERIAAIGGALVSEYPPGTEPKPSQFVARDRLQAALSHAVLVVESTVHGGTMHTARFANACGVPVWVVLTDAEVARGCRNMNELTPRRRGPFQLWRTGARRVDVSDIRRLLPS